MNIGFGAMRLCHEGEEDIKRVRDLVTCPVCWIKYSKIVRLKYFNNKYLKKWRDK